MSVEDLERHMNIINVLTLYCCLPVNQQFLIESALVLFSPVELQEAFFIFMHWTLRQEYK